MTNLPLFEEFEKDLVLMENINESICDIDDCIEEFESICERLELISDDELTEEELDALEIELNLFEEELNALFEEELNEGVLSTAKAAGSVIKKGAGKVKITDKIRAIWTKIKSLKTNFVKAVRSKKSLNAVKKLKMTELARKASAGDLAAKTQLGALKAAEKTRGFMPWFKAAKTSLSGKIAGLMDKVKALKGTAKATSAA